MNMKFDKIVDKIRAATWVKFISYIIYCLIEFEKQATLSEIEDLLITRGFVYRDSTVHEKIFRRSLKNKMKILFFKLFRISRKVEIIKWSGENLSGVKAEANIRIYRNRVSHVTLEYSYYSTSWAYPLNLDRRNGTLYPRITLKRIEEWLTRNEFPPLSERILLKFYKYYDDEHMDFG